MFSGANELNKRLRVCEVIVVAGYALPVVDHAVSFVAFKAVQKLLCTVPFYELRERAGLYLSHKSFAAVLCALPAAGKPLFAGAFPVLAPRAAGTFVRAAPVAMAVFRAKAAGKPAAPEY